MSLKQYGNEVVESVSLLHRAGAEVIRIERHSAIITYDMPGIAHHFLNNGMPGAPYPLKEDDIIVILRHKED